MAQRTRHHGAAAQRVGGVRVRSRPSPPLPPSPRPFLLFPPSLPRLKLRISRGFAKMRRIFGDLPFISLDEIDPVIEWIERLIEDLSVQEREAVIQIWRYIIKRLGSCGV